jgi:hypothetical protein
MTFNDITSDTLAVAKETIESVTGGVLSYCNSKGPDQYFSCRLPDGGLIHYKGQTAFMDMLNHVESLNKAAYEKAADLAISNRKK